MKLYLAGPINGRTDAECNDWRAWVKENWPGETLDPMVRDYRGRENECFVEIVDGDKADIRACDCFIALVDPERPSIGTTMEILYAWEQGKRVAIALVDLPPIDFQGRVRPFRISPWLRFHSHFIGSLTQCMDWLKADRT
jgi:nucleoside 2-deoxyribosyltransferase